MALRDREYFKAFPVIDLVDQGCWLLSPITFLHTRHLTFPKLLTLMLSGMRGSV